MNALTHGLTAKQAISPAENAEDFDEFQRGLLSALDPHDELEGVLADRIVIDAWRLRRVALLESALHRRGYQELIIENHEEEVRRYEDTDADLLKNLLKRVADADRQAHADALAKLNESRSALDDPLVRMTMAFEKHLGTFEQLSRHETAFSRSFFRNLHELQRLQAMRAGERVTPPAVVDVDINVRENGTGQDGAANPEAILQNKPSSPEPVSAVIEADATPIDDKKNQISFFITMSQKAQLARTWIFGRRHCQDEAGRSSRNSGARMKPA